MYRKTSNVTVNHAPPAKSLSIGLKGTNMVKRIPKELTRLISAITMKYDITKFNPLESCILLPKSHKSLLIHKDSVA